MTRLGYAPIAIAAIFAASPIFAQSTETTTPPPVPAVTEPAVHTGPETVTPATKAGCGRERHVMS